MDKRISMAVHQLPFIGIGRIRQFLKTNAVSRETVSWAEFEAVGEALFRRVDIDKDGVICSRIL